MPPVGASPAGRLRKGGGCRTGIGPFHRTVVLRGDISPAPERRNVYWTVPRIWPGETYVCIASGPGLTRDQVEHVQRARAAGKCRVITINGAIRRDGSGADLNAPFADVLYAADANWWRKAQNVPGFEGLKVSVQEIEFGDVNVLKHREDPGLSTDPACLHTGGNSGYQAINLGNLMGGTRALLLGYSMRLGPKGERHHHGDHPPSMNNPAEGNFRRWLKAFETLPESARACGLEIVNCTPDSALEMFPRARIEDVL